MNAPRDPAPPNRPPSQRALRRDRSSNFTRVSLADITLQEKLRQPGDISEFIALFVATARECGYAVSTDDVNGAMRARLPLAKGLVDSIVRETPLPPKGWLPVRASWHANQLYVHWSYFGDRPLREPFFESEIHRANFKPFNRLFRYSTPIAKLGDWLREHPALPPSGFIFHMGRCGSTLVSQMLAAIARSRRHLGAGPG